MLKDFGAVATEALRPKKYAIMLMQKKKQI
jgi:hypothetical protein